MTDEAQLGCITRFVDGPCRNPPTSGLPICGSCLRVLLDEPDPRRRRTLARNPGLAGGVVQQLAEDPDDQVRAQVAARSDLDTATTNRLANPDRESAPTVWRSMAATSGGGAHAWELLGTDDPTTLAILAANPSVDPDILDQLARYPDPDVSWTASATLAGQPPGDHIAERVAEARRFDGLPLGESAVPLSRPGATPPTEMLGVAPTTLAAAATSDTGFPVGGAPPPPETRSPDSPPAYASGVGGAGALPPRPSPDDPGGHGRRRGLGLLVGAGALVVIAAVVLVIAFTGSGSDSRTTTVGPDPSTMHTSPNTSRTPSTSGATTSTTTSSTTSTTTTSVPPTTKPAPTLPPTTPSPAITPPQAGPISQNFTITSDAGRFCKAVSVTVNFSPAPAYVAISDDTGAQVGGWSGASGQTRQLQLPRATTVLNVNVSAVGTSISVSGSASGDSC
ncbi:MAG TPA: hypothetical protein VFN21_01190 [Acidimicrobiales bacterium]|nr:hypothetical protein [Acidimicrobiales bacterium]